MRRMLTLGLLVLVLAGCAGVSGYPVFDREQTADDELPLELDVLDLTGYDTETARFVGDHDDAAYYLVMKNGGVGPCIVIASGLDSMAACGGLSGVTASGANIRTVRLVPAPAQEAEGWIVLSENVLVEDTEE